MLVFVLNKHGQPSMPCSPGQATVLQRTPFTMRLLYGSSGYKQPISLGVDAGTKHIGVSATTNKRVLYEAEVLLCTDIPELLATRREFRGTRRRRKTRYRHARFLNRKKSQGLAPSLQNKVDTHVRVIKQVAKILPVSRVTVKVAQFEDQVKRKTASLRDATQMTVPRWFVYYGIKEEWPNAKFTYGYITKNTRIRQGLAKSHRVDARWISGNPLAVSCGHTYLIKRVRGQNRQLHIATILKDGMHKANKATKYLFGYELFDTVLFEGQECVIFGRRTRGHFDLRKLDETKIHASHHCRNLRLLLRASTLLVEKAQNERREGAFLSA